MNRQDRNARQREKYEARVAEGRCIKCGVYTGGTRFCEDHKALHNQANIDSRRRRIHAGSIDAWSQQAVSRIRRRCRDAGIPCGITAKDIARVFPANRRCPVLRQPFVFVGPSRWNPSVDRRDSSQGYDPGNIQVVSLRANQIKSDATPKELRAVARWMSRKSLQGAT